MRKAKVENGRVVNIIEVDAENIPEWCADWPDADADTTFGHVWDGSTLRPPPIDIDAVSASVRQERNEMLKKVVDPIAGNILRWNALSPAQQEELAAYRQLLLDIPDQEGFPVEVEWPPVPEI